MVNFGKARNFSMINPVPKRNNRPWSREYNQHGLMSMASYGVQFLPQPEIPLGHRNSEGKGDRAKGDANLVASAPCSFYACCCQQRSLGVYHGK